MINIYEMAVGDDFPPVEKALDENFAAAGLLAIGGDLSVNTLLKAYSNSIFPWFSKGEPILWWTTNPRMVLHVDEFKIKKSLSKKIRKIIKDNTLQIKINTDFEQVIKSCAGHKRAGQSGTWINDAMINAYVNLHKAGYANSIEIWQDNELQAGLYCVAIGKAVFGESMFTKITDGSKIALSALCAICKINNAPIIDCQQETEHLAFMGARAIDRSEFLDNIKISTKQKPINWHFNNEYWQCLFDKNI